MACERVAAHLEDFAAVESEHGRDLVATILTAEANFLRQNDLGQLIARSREAGATEEVSSLPALRSFGAASRVGRKAREQAREQAELLIAEAWLREGYAQPA